MLLERADTIKLRTLMQMELEKQWPYIHVSSCSFDPGSAQSSDGAEFRALANHDCRRRTGFVVVILSFHLMTTGSVSSHD